MRILKDDFPGGRMAGNEDWETLARNVAELEKLSLIGGPFVVEGCALTFTGSGASYNLAAGTVALDGKLYRVPAQQVDLVPEKGLRAGPNAVAYSRPFTGLSVVKTAAEDRTVEVVAGTSTGTGKQMMLMSTSKNLRTYAQALKDATTPVGSIVMVNDLVPFGGLGSNGIGTGAWEGWRLCNGQGGTPDLTNKLVLGAGGAFNPGDTQDIATSNGSLSAQAVAFAQYTGFGNLWKIS